MLGVPPPWAFIRPASAATAPVLTSLRDVVVDTAGGGRVQIATGTGFTASSIITVDGVDVTTTYVSATEVQCTMPAHAPGSVDVKVRNGAAVSNGIGVTYGDMSSVAATLHWWRADLGATVDGAGKVVALADQVGDRDQSTISANAPTRVADAAYAGRDVLLFTTAASMFFDGAAGAAALDVPISIVSIGHATENTRSFYATRESSKYNMLWSAAGKLEFYGILGGVVGTTPNEALSPCACLVEDDGASARIYVDDLATPEATGGSKFSAADKFEIGVGVAGISPMVGEIAEIAIFSGILSSGDKAFVAAYLAQRYDLAVTA